MVLVTLWFDKVAANSKREIVPNTLRRCITCEKNWCNKIQEEPLNLPKLKSIPFSSVTVGYILLSLSTGEVNEVTKRW